MYVSQSRQIPFYNIIFVLILSSDMYLYLFLLLSLNSPVEGGGGEKSRKRSGFVIYSILEGSAFTAVKRDAQS